MRLHSDWGYLEQEFGCSIRERFLMAVRSLDNPKAVTPFLLECRSRRFGLFLHVEKGNVEAAYLPPDIVPVYYRPYFTFESSERPPYVHPTLVDAIRAVADGETSILVDPLMPMAVVSELRDSFSVQLEEPLNIGSVTLRRVSCPDIASRLARGRIGAAKAARGLLEKSPVRSRLEPFLQPQTDERFAALDQAIEHEGLAGLVVSSSLNLQEIAGVPVGRKRRPLAAFYRPGDSSVWVMEAGLASEGQQFPSPAVALRHVIPSGRVGVETEDVGFGLAHALELHERDVLAADFQFRRWRDESTLSDLAYYIIATRVTRHAIDASLDFARSALQRKSRITEMDAYAVYLRSMREFTSEAMPGLRAYRTLTNFHCGSRTIFPANAAAYPVDSDVNSLKIDAGCLLWDEEGFLLGCSDIARTLPLSDAGEELYEAFQDVVRNKLIPHLSAGRTGESVHAEAVQALWRSRNDLLGNPLFVDLADAETEYGRDVGHLLGKNNLAHLKFAKGDKQALREGMIACCEFQWPLRGHAIAYEDTCLVTRDGGLNITSDLE